MATNKKKSGKENNDPAHYRSVLGSLVESLTGKVGKDLLEMLILKSNINEFLIAKKLQLTINQTRNILYRLSDNRIVSFNRKKDKKKGWYTYFWTLDVIRALEFAESKVMENIKNFTSQRKNRESKRFYSCKICNLEVSEETALMNNFTCTECGTVYDLNESKELISDLDAKVVSFNSELDGIRLLLEGERKKVGKKIDSKNRREKEKRKVLRRERAKAKAKLTKVVPSKKKLMKKK
ncbi:MAG: hypothetical protein AABW73_04340 [Nanoarchaeota archaeon]